MPRPTKHAQNNPALGAFGAAVRTLRKSKGLSQESLADLAEIDRSYMGGIERGEHNLALINIQRIANALNSTVSELMTHANL
jgi:transcriptional regulator with XRE-family HTH domain